MTLAASLVASLPLLVVGFLILGGVVGISVTRNEGRVVLVGIEKKELVGLERMLDAADADRRTSET